MNDLLLAIKSLTRFLFLFSLFFSIRGNIVVPSNYFLVIELRSQITLSSGENALQKRPQKQV